MNIYLVRHGTTKSNLEKKYYGDHDVKLSAEGIAEGEILKENLKGITFDAIFCSEKRRALDTLNIIVGKKVSYIVDKRLNERHFGVFENKSYEEIRHEYKQELDFWNNDWKGYKLPKGESAIEAYNRTVSFMEELKNANYENVLIVTHGGIIRNVYCYILGTIDAFWKFSSKNGDITIIKYEYENWFIDSINHI